MIRSLRNSPRAPRLPSKTHSWHGTPSQADPNLAFTYYSCVPVRERTAFAYKDESSENALQYKTGGEKDQFRE